MVSRLLLLLIPLNVLACRGETPTTRPVVSVSIEQQAHDDLYFLASDTADGRGVGTPGIAAAADFIEARFKSLGLQPVPGLDGYRQPFEMTVGSKVGDATAMSAGDKPLKLDTDFRPLAWSPSKAFDGQLAFAGYAIADKIRDYDDFAGIDAKGKVVVALRYEPHDGKGDSRWAVEGSTRNARLMEKAKAATNAGAVALVIVEPVRHGKANEPRPDELMPFSGAGAGRSTIPVLSVTRAIADQWLASSGDTVEKLQQSIDTTGQPASRDVADVRLHGAVAIEPRKIQASNLVAMLPGTGPLANEYVVLGAHYDHLGHGGMGSMSPTATAVHPGADDNASGTTALLGVAAKLAAAGPLPRTVVFITFTGEESGLIGSQHFVQHPPIDLTKIATMMNLDMVGRVKNEMIYVGGDGTAAAFDAIVRAIDDTNPLTLKTMGRGGLGPSDHASFSQKSIPVLFFFSGIHEQYHRPTDTPDLINFAGLAEVIDLTADALTRIAALPKPEYVDRFDREGINTDIVAGTTQPTTRRARGGEGGPPARRVRLGIVPDMASMESGDGILVAGVSDNSPASRAGVKEGDRLTQLGDVKLASLYDLQEALAKLEPGKAIALQLVRDGKPMTLDVKLDGAGSN